MPQISAYGAMAGANLKRVKITNRRVYFNVYAGTSGCYGEGSFDVTYDPNTGYLRLDIVNGSGFFYGSGLHGFISFSFPDGGSGSASGTAGPNSLYPLVLTGVVPDYAETEYLNIRMVVYSDFGGQFVSDGYATVQLHD